MRLRRIVLFLAAGSAGFAVDLAVLSALMAVGAGPYVARAGSFLLAVLTTYFVNATLTFGAHERIGFGSFTLYLTASLAGLATNLIVYVAAVASGVVPALALAIASATALVVNYLGYGMVFGHRP